jgi:hypothetical protein
VGNYHRLNAVLKRVMGGKGRGEMTTAEMEAAIGWLERKRLAEHVHLVRDDPRYAFTARRVALASGALAEAGQRRSMPARRGVVASAGGRAASAWPTRDSGSEERRCCRGAPLPRLCRGWEGEGTASSGAAGPHGR